MFLGLAWYTLTVAPLLQVLQVGNAEMADRYAYLPSAGIFLVLGWGFAAIIGLTTEKSSRRLPVVAGGVYVLVLAALTFSISPVWRDGISLWTRVIERYPDSPKGWFNRGHALSERRTVLRGGLRLQPDHRPESQLPVRLVEPGPVVFFPQGLGRGARDFDRELRSRPDDLDIRFWRANALAALGRYDEAVADLTTVIAGMPGNFEATFRRGLVYSVGPRFHESRK